MLEVQLLEAGAKAPVVGHAGEDLGYDIFALEDITLPYGKVVLVRTGIAVAAYTMSPRQKWDLASGRMLRTEITPEEPLGLLIRDRSSMAAKGIVTSGGVIDAGYRGEVKVLMTYTKQDIQFEETYTLLPDFSYEAPYHIMAGDKIAQMVPVPVLTGEVFVKGSLSAAARGDAAFGSTGR